VKTSRPRSNSLKEEGGSGEKSIGIFGNVRKERGIQENKKPYP